MNAPLQQFLSRWDDQYAAAQVNALLFHPNITKKVPLATRQRFALLFYHLRGHFDRFLWLTASLAESLEQRQKVLDNMREEFGAEKEGQKSHEQLYYDFCEELGVNILAEVRDEKNNLPFIREFNRGHQRFLVDGGPIRRWAAFLAYERLDNLDYKALLQLVKGWGVSKKGKVFFLVHSQVTHFEKASAELESMWEKDTQAVKDGFNFIADHQAAMWIRLSEVLGL